MIAGCTVDTVGDREATSLEKKALRVLYGLSADESGVVIDHLIPHALCGADTPNNLWPEEKITSYAKDTVERRVIDEVQAGTITLEAGQDCFRTDWTACP